MLKIATLVTLSVSVPSASRKDVHDDGRVLVAQRLIVVGKATIIINVSHSKRCLNSKAKIDCKMLHIYVRSLSLKYEKH